MFNKLITRLTLLASLLLVSFAMPALADDKVGAMVDDKSKATQSSMTKSTQQMEKVNINQATNKQLAAIKGIGKTKAQAIIDYREAKGNFTDLKQLMNVKGIGQGTLKKITPFISL
ncbi:competence protein ComEA [Psychromonas marina]|uniref:Competence protein ComEA n=1 Tax=Psychromonas marina TaxID=88364 RepID=A0ABQ6E0N4_9GAMM|nr:helix-hairpin-helix domain-containing protein [Psychromonas marina]GLS90948.1 competence protein ComEA [Psychromonas marina]